MHELNDLLDALRDGRTIEAINHYRYLTGTPLKDSMDRIESIQNGVINNRTLFHTGEYVVHPMLMTTYETREEAVRFAKDRTLERGEPHQVSKVVSRVYPEVRVEHVE